MTHEGGMGEKGEGTEKRGSGGTAVIPINKKESPLLILILKVETSYVTDLGQFWQGGISQSVQLEWTLAGVDTRSDWTLPALCAAWCKPHFQTPNSLH